MYAPSSKEELEDRATAEKLTLALLNSSTPESQLQSLHQLFTSPGDFLINNTSATGLDAAQTEEFRKLTERMSLYDLQRAENQKTAGYWRNMLPGILDREIVEEVRVEELREAVETVRREVRIDWCLLVPQLKEEIRMRQAEEELKEASRTIGREKEADELFDTLRENVMGKAKTSAEGFAENFMGQAKMRAGGFVEEMD